MGNAASAPVFLRLIATSSGHVQTSRRLWCVTWAFLESDMGKYLLGWILGVPLVVLVGIYVVMHVL